jgi:hypothetical protein
MKLFFKIFNIWILFLTAFAMSSGFLNHLIITNSIPDYFRILFAITLMCTIISACVWVITLIVFLINDDIGDYFK